MINSDQFLDIHKILAVCTSFSEFVQAVTYDVKIKEETAKISSKTAQEKRKEIGDELNKIVTADTFGKSIMEFDKNFSQLLLSLLDKIINQMSNSLGETKIGNVLYRLDFNDYYRDQLDKLRQERHAKDAD